jgi:hypothetical protein
MSDFDLMIGKFLLSIGVIALVLLFVLWLVLLLTTFHAVWRTREKGAFGRWFRRAVQLGFHREDHRE